MERSQLITDLVEDMAAMKRFLASAHIQGPKDMPTHAQLGILLILAHEGPQHVKDLATRLRMTSSAATQLIDGLVKEGSVARSPVAKDRRKVSIALTPAGKRTLTEAKKRHIAAFTAMLEPLSNAELTQWKDLQRKLLSSIRPV